MTRLIINRGVLHGEDAQQAFLPQIREHTNGGAELVGFVSGCGRRGGRFGQNQMRCGVDLGERELAVERLRRLRSRMIGGSGVGEVARCFPRAADPIIGARLADRSSDGARHGMKMGERRIGLVEETQCDPAGKELGLAIFGAVFGADPAIGGEDISGAIVLHL